MCSHRVLHHSKNGLVRTCLECGRFQVAYGVVGLSLSRRQFNQFSSYLDGLVVNDPECTLKTHYVALPSNESCLMLSNVELTELRTMLTLAKQQLLTFDLQREFGINACADG